MKERGGGVKVDVLVEPLVDVGARRVMGDEVAVGAGGDGASSDILLMLMVLSSRSKRKIW